MLAIRFQPVARAAITLAALVCEMALRHGFSFSHLPSFAT